MASHVTNAGNVPHSLHPFIQVLNNGQVKEYDSPYALLQNPNSQLKGMVEQTGPAASRKLHQMALDAYRNQ